MSDKKLCDACKFCIYKDDCDEACIYGYCPFRADEDYGSAVVRELKEQNGDL